MINVRRADKRGHFNFGWLDTYHTFSFGDYYDPRHMGFRALRVINEDRVQPGHGFPTHGHRDMEIVTYVLAGGLAHRDSLGTGSVIRPGDVQRMSAGTGIRHSEFNASQDEPVHLLQIWLLPEREGIEPGYEQQSFDREELRGRLKLVAAPGGGDGAVNIHQDAKLYAACLAPGEAVTHELGATRHAWLQVARGSIELNGAKLEQSDGAAVSAESALTIKAVEDSEVLLFDLK